MDQAPRRNIELKARHGSLETAHAIARGLPSARQPDQYQRDTYFHCPRGRLKLREIRDQRAELIWYARVDEPGPKASDYRIVAIPDPEGLKAALEAAWGIRGIVEKQRAIYLYRNVRIHLDEVRDLGTFLEFEAVLSDGEDAIPARLLLEQLKQSFRIADSDLVRASYGELIDQFPRT